MSDHGYGHYDDGRDREAVIRLLMLAFGSKSAEATGGWMERAGTENLRVFRERGRAVGCAVQIPMGQYYGGKRLEMYGVAGVAVAPECRGRGIGGEIMEGLVKEFSERRLPLSVLYPAVQSIYRRYGYEQSGHRFFHYLDLKRVGVRESGSRLREATREDREEIRGLAEKYGRAHNGFVARGDYCWDRIWHSSDEERDLAGLVAPGPNGLEGAVFFDYAPGETGTRVASKHVRVTDVIATEPHAARAILGALSALSTIAGEALIPGGPVHPLLYTLDQQPYRTELADHWMTRVVVVERALTGRGYAPGINASVHLTVVDEVLLGNAGKWILEVEDGKAVCRRGGRGDVKLHVRQLASVFTGYMSPVQLAQAGLVDGPDEVVETLGAALAGPAPFMHDFF